MPEPLLQIYSATYSNVPVFEFVTPEGPIMRRKLDLWINATHILKIAKFPKARRTRVLEKDIQTGIHDKVQGGYGKYQGTYVPLDIGAELARNFGVYDILQPMFDFVYVEGTSETPPPAPKHNHALASNLARRQALKQKRPESDNAGDVKRPKIDNGNTAGDDTDQNKPKRVALPARKRPLLAESRTVPLSAGPSLGTFSSSRPDLSFSGRLPPLLRQDTERDALLIMASNMNVRQADLEPESSDEQKPRKHDPFMAKELDDELMSGKELFGSRAFIMLQNLSQSRNYLQNRSPESASRLLSLNGSVTANHEDAEEVELSEYFTAILNFLMEDNSLSKPGAFELPKQILNPPQPLLKINIARPIDNDGNTIFHWACLMANVALIEFLLTIFSSFITSDIKNYNGETPLMFLVQFRNSFQLNNFPAILDMLFDSILSVDKLGRTVLHHIAFACDATKFDNVQRNNLDLAFKDRKERFANYYFDVVLSKIIDFPDYQLLQGNESRSLEDKKEVISKFINHQDNNGNTAFHIVAHNMSKRCIKTFIKFHRFIDFSLRNHVNFSVEDYLASHNYVLRLENDEGIVQSPNENGLVASESIFPVEHTQSFESQLHTSRMTMNLHNSTINTLTEKLSELSYSMDTELKKKDDRLLSLYKYFRVVGYERFKSQKAVLQLFNLDYLLEDVAKEFDSSVNGSQDDSGSTLIVLDTSRDKVIQEEITRLVNDLTFQKITAEEKFLQSLQRFTFTRERIIAIQIKKLIREFSPKGGEDASDYELAVRLNKQILKRKDLANELYYQESKVPLISGQKDDCKENELSAEAAHKKLSELVVQEKPLTGEHLRISDYPPSDKLYKYCKLVALSCGMSMSEVESSINLLEQSITKNVNGV